MENNKRSRPSQGLIDMMNGGWEKMQDEKINSSNYEPEFKNVIHVAIPLQDLNDRISVIEKQMEILKDNKPYEYTLSKMHSLLIELRDTYNKITL